jgi:succinate-semialdehyde dehydrogenase / glutarate-semialdehyde dehydrogenase
MNIKNEKLLQKQGYINGKWADAINKSTFEVTNPFNQKVIASVANMNGADAKAAIEAANAALPAWRAKTASQRSLILRKWFDLIYANTADLALILTTEQGKPLAEAVGEIKYGASFVEWFAEEAKRVYGDVIPGQTADTRIVVIKQPIGVVAAITPWNFPNAMITRKVAPALAAGCTVVIKPSELTPLSALALAALAEQAGFPAGVLNIVIGTDAAAIGAELTSNKMVRKLSFTGSTRVGKLLIKQCADTVKKVSMELGGNAPFIVFDDADIEEAVKGAIGAKFRNAGQTCICANRIFAQAAIYEEFTQKLSEAVKALKVGNGTEKDVVIGPLINQAALEKVSRIVANARENGATVLTGGSASDGYFFEPTVLTNVDKTMAVHQEEIFGPVAPVFKFETEAEAIALANDTDYGLAAYFYGRDYARIWRVGEALEYGMVGINTGAISTTLAPFGGIKESGFGREGSKYGMDEFLEIKYMCFGGVDL